MILDYYFRKNKLHNVNADDSVENVTKTILENIKNN
jgi:adenylate kinase family enzyme